MSASVSRDAACTAWQLPNGLAVRVLSTPGKPRAAALLSVAAGSHNEPQAWPGLAHLLEHVLFGDSQQYRGAERLMPWTEAAGGQVNASTEAASTQFFFEVPAAALAEGITFNLITFPKRFRHIRNVSVLSFTHLFIASSRHPFEVVIMQVPLQVSHLRNGAFWLFALFLFGYFFIMAAYYPFFPCGCTTSIS
ncbi:hypothetical protein NVIRENTERO_01352 [Sodalis praecaptivus]|nr:hypothetical protein NVIRENTERO_01352 [Sodalis praecaptivus]